MQDEGNDRLPLSANGREMTSRLQSIRDFVTDSALSADVHRAALDTVDSEIADRLTTEREGGTYDNTMHRLVENDVNDRYSHLLERHGSTSPSSIARSRRRLNRPLDRIQRQTQTDRMHRLASRSDLQEQPSANLPQLSPVQISRTRQASDEQDSDMDLHQSRDGKSSRKRRKLDDGTAEQVRLFPEYGVEGTLLPGNLKMIVLDVEGDSDAQCPTDQMAKVKLPSHDNKDPYRTKRNNCDILMKHYGGYPFALSKLIVKLPRRDYDAPPLQGMIFVSMNRETLLSQASHYNSYFPFSHSYHKRRYDSYRPSVDYMRSARSPRPPYRTRRLSDQLPQESPWYDSRLSSFDPAEIPSRPGIQVSRERIIDPEESPSYGPRSPRPWEATQPSRMYADRYRPSRSSITALDIVSLSPTSSEDEEDDQNQDRSQSNPDDLEETSFDRNIPRLPTASHLDLRESEARQRNILEQMRLHRDQGNGYFRVPSEMHSQPRRGQEVDDDEEPYSAEQIAAIESTLARRANNIEALRRRARIGESNTSDEPASNTRGLSHASQPTHPQAHSNFHSTKRLPGCTGMLQGQSPHSPSDRDAVAPHATFSVGRESGGGIAVNFTPEV